MFSSVGNSPAPAKARVAMPRRPHTYHESNEIEKSVGRPSAYWNTDPHLRNTSQMPTSRASYPVGSFKITESRIFPALKPQHTQGAGDPSIGYSDMFNHGKLAGASHHWREGLRSPHDPESKMQLRVRGTLAGFTDDRVSLSHLPDLEASQNTKFLEMEQDGSFCVSNKATLDLQTLAGWLDDSRPTAQSGAYAMLLVAKDLIRRLLSDSVKIWNSSEEQVRMELEQTSAQLEATRSELEEEQKRSAQLTAKIQESINGAASQEVASRKDLLHTQIRLDKTKADLDYAWIQLDGARKQIDDLQEENAEIRRCIEDSLWNPDRLNDLLTFILGLDHYVRFRMLQTLLMGEAEQGRMLELVRSLKDDVGKDVTDTIVDAFVIHKLESSDDPMELLRDLAQQRVQVLGQQGRRRNVKASNMWHVPAMARTKAAATAKKEKQSSEEEGAKVRREEEWLNAQSVSRTSSGGDVEKADAETQTEAASTPQSAGGGRFAFLARTTIAGMRKGSPYGANSLFGKSDGEDGGGSPEGGVEKGGAGEGASQRRRNSVLLSTKKNKKGKKGQANEVTPLTIGKLIPQIYEDKVLSDLIDLREGRRPVPLPEFVKEFFSRRYGLAGLATKNYKELMEGLSKYRDHSLRISHFARNLGIGAEEGYSDFVSEFYCRCLGKLIPQEIIADRMSAKDCSVDFDVAVQCLDHMLPSNTPLQPSPGLRGRLLEKTKIGKKFQPVIDIDEFMHHVMLEFLRLSGRANATPSNPPDDTATPRSKDGSRASSRRPSMETGLSERRKSIENLGAVGRRSSLTGQLPDPPRPLGRQGRRESLGMEDAAAA